MAEKDLMVFWINVICGGMFIVVKSTLFSDDSGTFVVLSGTFSTTVGTAAVVLAMAVVAEALD